jgi:pimeloyl-ACP methyl ester carboxylesterase
MGALRRTLAAAGATRRVMLFAHSLGTLLAACYAERYPEEVDRLLLLGAPVDEEDARRRLRADVRPAAAPEGRSRREWPTTPSSATGRPPTGLCVSSSPTRIEVLK